ncbi:MAG: TonB family protein [Nitrospinae bacterium]|nr:TonB family protein [Nitrospinota bacterium]
MTKKLLAELEAIDSMVPEETSKSVLEELEQLARLSPRIKAKKTPPPKSMQEETFKEKETQKLEDLSSKPEPAVVPPLVGEFLDDAADPKKKEEGKETRAEERELNTLARQSLELKPKKAPKVQSNLLKELEALEKMSTLVPDTSVDEEAPAKPAPVLPEEPVGKSLQPLLEKLSALEKHPLEIEIDISPNRMNLRKFQSGIRTMKTPSPPPSSKATEAKALEFSAHEGSPVSSFLSLYIGEIYQRVYSKWKTPLGAKAKNVVVAFTIFTMGNIDKPVVRKSAGNEDLDSIAMRAIYDSVPFPPLPKELKQSNLRVSIIFKYVPEEN